MESPALANDLIERLGIHKLNVGIADAAKGTERFLVDSQPVSDQARGLALENMQARLRGLALMALSNAEGGIVLSTGNKAGDERRLCVPEYPTLRPAVLFRATTPPICLRER